MKYAIIENGVVVNTVVAEEEFAMQQGWVLCPESVGIGWSHNGSNYQQPATPQIQAEPTKEELLAQLQALQSQIQALE